MSGAAPEPWTDLNVETDVAVAFDAPVGDLGRLKSAKMSFTSDGPKRFELTIHVPFPTFTRLEAQGWFGNTAASRSKNLRGAFDPARPVEVALWLSETALAAAFGTDQGANHAALVAQLKALSGRGADASTDPARWVLESAVQPVPGQTFAAGYRNTALAG